MDQVRSDSRCGKTQTDGIRTFGSGAPVGRCLSPNVRSSDSSKHWIVIFEPFCRKLKNYRYGAGN